MNRRDVLIAGALVLLAIVVRVPFTTFGTFDGEAWAYQTSRSLGGPAQHVSDLHTGEHPQTRVPFWLNPGHPVLFAPAAALGFEAWRLAHIVAASILPGAVYVLLRQERAGIPVAAAAAAVVALHPFWAPLGSFGLSDPSAASLFLVGLWASRTGRAMTSGALFAVSILVDTTAWLAVAVWFVMDWRAHVRAATGRWWPFQMGKSESAALGALAASTAVLLYGWVWLKGASPFQRAPGLAIANVERLAPTVWLYIPILVGLTVPRARPFATLALAYPLVRFVLGLTMDDAVSLYDGFLPATLVLLATARVAQHAFETRRSRAAVGATAFAALVLVGGILVPHSGASSRAMYPLSETAHYSLLDFYAFPRDPGGLWRLAVEASGSEHVVLVDLPEFLAFHPLGGASVVRTAGGPIESRERALDPLIERIESPGMATLLANLSSPLQDALRKEYGSCEQAHARDAWLLWGDGCGRHLEGVRAALATSYAGNSV